MFGDEFTSIPHEHRQELQLFEREIDGAVAMSECFPARIELELAKLPLICRNFFHNNGGSSNWKVIGAKFQYFSPRELL